MNAMLGSNGSNRIYGDFNDLPERYHDAVKSGIRFIELRHPKLGKFPRISSGFFNVSVKAYLIEGTTDVAYDEKWQTGKNAYISFESVSKHGLSVAFMPDDRYYHNRVMLMDNPQYAIHRMHTSRDGIVPGTFIKNEIDCLREVLREMVPIYKVVEMLYNREVYYSYKKDDCKDYIQKFGGGAKYNIVPGTKSTYKPHIMDLIKKYNRQHTGWTDCDKFREEIIPQVNDLIGKRRKSVVLDGDTPAVGTDFVAQMAEFMKNLRDTDPEKFEVLRSIMPSKPAATENTTATVSTPPSAPVFTKGGLRGRPVEEVRQIAKTMGIDILNKNKESVIDEILAHQGNDSTGLELKIEDDQEMIVT